MIIVSEQEFRERLLSVLVGTDDCGSVTGPGRSGAVAAVYASHMLGIPFIPYGAVCPSHLGRLLIVDTARESGATLRKAERRYRDCNPFVIVAFEEPPRVAFWYEADKPQRYRHERAPLVARRRPLDLDKAYRIRPLPVDPEPSVTFLDNFPSGA